MKPSSRQFQLLREAIKNEPPDTSLGKAVVRLRGHFVLGDGDQFFYEKFIEMFVAIREALHEIDPTLPPSLPPFLMDPAFIAKFFRIPLEKFNFQGGKQSGVDPSIVKDFEKALDLLKKNVVLPKVDKLSQKEEDILNALGDKTLTGEKIAELTRLHKCDGHFKGVLSNLVKRRILGNNHPGYFRR